MSLAKLVMKGKEWADNIADLLGIAHGVIYGVFILIALVAAFVFIKWGGKKFMKKSQPFSMVHTDDTKQEDELNPEEIQEKLIKRHEVVLLSMEVPHTISLHEGHEGLNFD